MVLHLSSNTNEHLEQIKGKLKSIKNFGKKWYIVRRPQNFAKSNSRFCKAKYVTAAKTPPIICQRRFSDEKVGNRKN